MAGWNTPSAKVCCCMFTMNTGRLQSYLLSLLMIWVSAIPNQCRLLFWTERLKPLQPISCRYIWRQSSRRSCSGTPDVASPVPIAQYLGSPFQPSFTVTQFRESGPPSERKEPFARQ
jgi:hypothetical protein